MKNAQELLSYVLKSLAQYPDQIVIEAFEDSMGILLMVTLAQDDMGIIIGRKGETSTAIRTLVRVEGYKDGGKKISVKFQSEDEAARANTH